MNSHRHLWLRPAPGVLLLVLFLTAPAVMAGASLPDEGITPRPQEQVPPESQESKPEDPAKAEEERQKEAAKAAAEAEAKEAAEETQEKRKEDVAKIEEAARDPWLAKWGRFRTATRDITTWNFNQGMFRMRFGLRFQGDATAGSVSAGLKEQVGDVHATLKARRSRFFADGDFLRRYHFRFEYDAGEDADVKDAYIDNLGAYKLKVMALRIGNFKEPFSLSRQTSSNYNAFMERPLPVQTIAPGRNIGIAAYGSNLKGRLGWTAGLFTNSSESDDNRGTSNLTFTGRLVGLPRYRDEGRQLVHLGLSLSFRKPEGDSLSFATRPEARFSPFFIATPDAEVDTSMLAALEFAAVKGPFWVQGEVIAARSDIDQAGNLTLGGGYAEMGWFLTGESRPYQRYNNSFGRLEPIRPYQGGGNPFKKDKNGGALELAGRLSMVDLDDGAIQGGEMLNASLGVNWYLTRASRFSLNYVHSRVEDQGHANIVMLRLQFNPGYHWPPLNPNWGGREQVDIDHE